MNGAVSGVIATAMFMLVTVLVFQIMDIVWNTQVRLAQVNGCRGETAKVEEMERRINYDLQYLRDWTLMLDLKILAQTVTSLLSDKKAY